MPLRCRGRPIIRGDLVSMSTPLPELPSLVVGHVSHTRRTPLNHSFRNRSYQWLVDLDDMPRLPQWLRPLAGFRAEDHLDGGSSGAGIRGDLKAFLQSHDVSLGDFDRVLMLANARVLGHVFDPLTVFWIFDDQGVQRAQVFEVHNTYGGRHSYLLQCDDSGRSQTDKAFYVSPFNDVSGTYKIQLRLDVEVVSVSVGLERGSERVFTAVTRGTPEPATTRSTLRVSLTHALMPYRVSALIRFHGVLLWLRKLPIVPRPTTKKGVTP